MQIQVSLKFGDGDFHQGFGPQKNSVLVVSTEGKSIQIEIKLPPAPEIPVLYQKWKDEYINLANPRVARIKLKKITHSSWPERYQECDKIAQELRTKLNEWLWGVKSKLESVIELNRESEIIFIIYTQHIKSQYIKDILHRLPWQEWDCFTRNDYIEAALCLNESQTNLKEIDDEVFRRVRITSIFGESEGIDVTVDKELIEKLNQRGAELIALSQPKRPDFIKLWDEPCDVLFYSGHSYSEQNSQVGFLQINQQESLNLEEIRNTFREAVKKGLKLAFFNSCDGLGLAQQLANLNLPYIIVWREQVPDKIAQDFLRYFLRSFCEGKSLFTSVRDARVKLVELTENSEKEKQLPGVNWLPIICQNTTDKPPTWEDLGGLTGKLIDSPYKGLSAFGEEDKDFFFGRDNIIADLVKAVNTKPLVPVIGASGSGKSSVVFAGLVPQLRNVANVQIVSFRPGKNPFDALAVALSSPSQYGLKETEDNFRLKQLELEINFHHNEKELCNVIESIVNSLSSQRFVLIADQFEELYTLTAEKQRQPFLDALLYAVRFAPAFTLVLTLRADFYGHALSYRPFSDVLQAGIYNLAPMNPQELRAAIEKPAHKMKVELEEGLTSNLIDDLGKKPERLPLLEFTLTQLWDKHDKWYLTHQAYKEIGGLEKALAYADSVLNSLSIAAKQQAERIFIQLVRPGEGTEDTKRVATRVEVGESNWNLVKHLADKRLVVTGWDEINQIETVEIIHEALIQEWGTFREWIRRNREFRIWQERLKPDVREWENKKYDSEALLQGTQLAIAQDWLKQRRDELTSLEQDFISASVKRRDKERGKQKRRRQLTISGLVGGLMLVSTFAGISEIRRTDAEAGKISSVAENFFSQNDHEVALTEAIKAGKLISKSIWKPWVAPETRMQVVSTLREAVYGYQIKTLKGHGQITSISFSPDGKTIASAFDDGTVTLWDSTTGKKIKSFKAHSKFITSISFLSDNKTIITASTDIVSNSSVGTVKLWDITKEKEIKTHKFKMSSDLMKPSHIRLSSDGKKITYTSFDGTVKQWDSISGKEITHWQGSYGIDPFNSLTSTNGNIIVFRPINDGGAELKFWDITTRKEMKTLKGKTNGFNKFSFSPDGKTIALASDEGKVKLLDISTGREIKTFKLVDSKWVSSLSFSPDGKTIALDSQGTVRLLDISTGREIKTFKLVDSKWARRLSFSPDGETIALTSQDTVTLLNSDTAEKIKTLKGHSEGVKSLSFSPNSKTIASASDDGTVKLWNTINGREIKTLKGHSQGIINASFSPVAKTIAFASDDNRIRIFSIGYPPKTKILKGHSGKVNSISFSPDGKIIASASDDKTVKLWDITTGKEIKTFEGHLSAVNSVSFSRENKTLASASDDKTVKLWDITTAKEIKTFKGHLSAVNSISFSPDNKTIASASDDKTVKLWDITTAKEIKTLKDYSKGIQNVSFSPDGKNIAFTSGDNTVNIWDINTDKEIKTFKGHSKTVNSISFSPDGKRIVSASDDSTAKLWDIFTGRQIKTLPEGYGKIVNVSFSVDGKTITSLFAQGNVIPWHIDATGKEITMGISYGWYLRGINSVIFSPDGKTLASASSDGTVKLWNIRTGKEITTLEGHTGIVSSISFSPDGKTIVSAASNDTTLKLWDTDTGKEIKTFKANTRETTSVSFSPNGKTIASASRDNTVKLWDVTNGRKIRTLSHSTGVNSVNFSPDGNTIASASHSGTVKLWDSYTGKELKTLLPNSGEVNSISFSPDGKTIAFALEDNTVKLWDINTKREITTLKGLGVSSVSFSPDGKTIASASDDGTVILWNFDLESLLSKGCNLIHNYLQNNPDVSESDKRMCDGIK